MSNHHWIFPEDKAGRWRGLNSPDTEHFRRSPITSLARELIQNSLDAALSPDQPVIVRFDLINVSKKHFPDAEGLQNKLREALACPQNSKDERTCVAIEGALKVLTGRRNIEVLKISESNTRGMAGPHYDYNSPFYAYTKGSGLSQKDGGKIGSFGIGKKAPMANAMLRTIFVSTRYPIETGTEFLCQGLAEWVSHVTTANHDKVIDGAGFWGKPGAAAPASEPQDVPEWLRRDDVGTNIYVCGFKKDTPDWDAVLVSSVLCSFFKSIRDGRLEVAVGSTCVNSNTIEVLFADEKLNKALEELEDEEHRERFQVAKSFYRCLNSDQSVILATQVQDPLGHFSLRVLVEEGLQRVVGFIREGMFIGSNCVPNVKQFRNTLDFVAVVNCETDSGSKVLRDMEPPEHNAFEGARVEGGQKLLNILGKRLRDQLNKLITPEYANEAAVSFMADLFGIESESGEQNTNSPVEIDPNGRVKQMFKATTVKIPRLTAKDLEGFDDRGDGVAPPPDKSGEGQKTRPQPGSGGETRSTSGDGNEPLGAEVTVVNPRTVRVEAGTVETFLTLPKAGDFLVMYEISGSDHDEVLRVVSTNNGRPSKGGVILTSEGKSERIQVKVKFERSVLAAFVVKAYEI
jgi:hypothetical protein